ncbi:phage minor head protein [Thalassolituus oleivorans]|uniref:Phage (Mu-like) virion morphogenesis protein n=1 Tax=Thalassolituus oleivorans MIL-1 TaxID=1298593 RepID=M5DZJ7_9GAMM|nr:phage minor head protein [Thalassolituus oleivorans]CCU70924.1 Phage (Mu-like) virion morphogenesis protein [Thalassolituus oleivorans MIL-1]
MPDYRFPANPPEAVLAWFRAKGLKPSFDYREVWAEEHAQAFTVAKAMRMDVLTTIREALDQALAEGKTLEQFRKELTPTLQKLGWWGRADVVDPTTGEVINAQLGSPRRLKKIYATNMKVARAAGQWERIERRKKTHPYLVYELGPSENHRAQHVAWAGIILRADDPFWQTHYPPNGWGCKCRVRQINQREYDKLVDTGKYTTTAPRITKKEWINDRTGEALQVPIGIDPGWDYNPGMHRAKALADNADRSAAELKKAAQKPAPKASPTLPPDSVLSTAKNVTQAGIDQVLSELPNSQVQVAKVAEFLNRRPIKTLMIKQTEMGTGKTAYALKDKVGKFLGLDNAWGAYNTRKVSQVNGFTYQQGEHVVVKVKATDNLLKTDIDAMKKSVSLAIETERTAASVSEPLLKRWTITETYEKTAAAKSPGQVITWLHELGHQVHFWAGTPRVPGALKDTYLTRYANTNNHEWHAEHFTAWVIDRDALAGWNLEVAEYFDRMVDNAIGWQYNKGKRNP